MLDRVCGSLEVSGLCFVAAKVDGAEWNNDSAHGLLAVLGVAVVHGEAEQVLRHLVIVNLWRNGSCYIEKDMDDTCEEYTLVMNSA